MDPDLQQPLVLNLQACRVSISGQSMQPLSKPLRDESSFVDVFGLSAKNAQQVMVTSQTNFENVEQLCIEHQGMTYLCEVWKPIVAKDYVQLQMEQDRLDWKTRLTEGKLGENVERCDMMDLAGLDTTVSVPQMPIRRGDSKDLQYLGHIFKWVSVDLDKPSPSIEMPSTAARDLPDLDWVQHYLRQANHAATVDRKS